MSGRIDIWVESAGLGHVTRQLNLLEHMRSEKRHVGQVRFIVDDEISTQRAIARASHTFVVRDENVAIAFAKLRDEWADAPPALFILDSVNHDQERNAGLVLNDEQVPSVVFIDDIGDRDVRCDLLVNALPSLSRGTGKKWARRSVRGVEYLILPPEYLERRRPRVDRAAVKEGFAFFGGADLQNFAEIFLDAIALEPVIPSWSLLLGPMYKQRRQVIERIRSERLPVTPLEDVDSMAQQLTSADVAVLAAGNTLSEAAAIGTPTVVFCQNPVQKANAEFFSQKAGVLDLGLRDDSSRARLTGAIRALATDHVMRADMSREMMQTVDSLGGRRISGMIGELIGGSL